MIYISLVKFYYLAFFLLSDLQPSSRILSLSLFLLSDLHSIKESYHLGFVSDLHPSSRILSLSLFLLSDLHLLRNLIT